MVAAPIFGYLGDRFNRKVILSCGVFFWSAVTFSSSFIPRQVRRLLCPHPHPPSPGFVPASLLEPQALSSQSRGGGRGVVAAFVSWPGYGKCLPAASLAEPRVAPSF